jgi:transposase InsO family protein
MEMDVSVKIAKQRLSVLELAERLGNITEACRRRGMDRTSFYEWKRRFQTHGLEGLKDLPPIHKSHPQAVKPEVESRIIELALEHPSYGCNKLEKLLSLEGPYVSNVTIQKILIEHGLGSRYDRWLALERKSAEQRIALTAEQVAYIEKRNPSFKERHVESSGPGQLLSQDTFFVGTLKGVGRVSMHTVIDTYGSFAFGFLHTTKQPEAAVVVVHNDVVPFYKAHGIEVKAILTDNGREYCGTEAHPYELYLALNDIEHRRTQVRRPQTNGFVERFHRTVLDEFFRIVFRKKLYETVASLQEDLDSWLHEYNYERPHLGYRNQGRRPWETIEMFLKGTLKL